MGTDYKRVIVPVFLLVIGIRCRQRENKPAACKKWRIRVPTTKPSEANIVWVDENGVLRLTS